jgi:hypothetical protein
VGSGRQICVKRGSPCFAGNETICGLPILPQYSIFSAGRSGETPHGVTTNGADRAKRTQFAEAILQNKANLPSQPLTLTREEEKVYERNRAILSFEKQSQFAALRLLPPLSRGQACCAPRNDMRAPGRRTSEPSAGGTGKEAIAQNKANLALRRKTLTLDRVGTYERNEKKAVAEKQSQFAAYGVTTSGAGVTCGGILVYWAAGWSATGIPGLEIER